MKKISKKSIVVSIILLLIGVSVSSALSVDTKSTISNNQSVEDCDCEEVSDTNLVKVNRLLNRIEFYINIFLLKYGAHSEITNNCHNILDIINSDGFWEDFCDAIANLAQSIQDLINNNGGIFKLLTPLFVTLISIWMLFCWLY